MATKQLSTQKQQISHRMMEIQNTVNSYVGQMRSHDESGHLPLTSTFRLAAIKINQS